MLVQGKFIPVIDIVENDEPVAAALKILLESAGLESQYFQNGEDYLGYLEHIPQDPREMTPGCVLLDIRLGTTSGLLVFDEMLSRFDRYAKPVIFLTGHGDMDTAIDVLTRGANDFISKPFSSDVLLMKVERATQLSLESLNQSRFHADIAEKLRSLTAKERMVLQGIVVAKSSRIIAEESGNSVRTIELHRARILEKMQVENAIELSGLLARAGWTPDTKHDT